MGKDCCSGDNWGTFCQWGGALSCVFFITVNIIVVAEYGSEMDKITIVLRFFSLLFAFIIALMSIDCLRKWCKGWLACAWFLSNWGTRGFFLVYLGVVAASSYAIEHFDSCGPVVPGTPSAKDEDVERWVDVSRYVAGALLIFFGLLYAFLSCCGVGADEEQIPQPAWGKGYADVKQKTPEVKGQAHTEMGKPHAHAENTIVDP